MCVVLNLIQRTTNIIEVSVKLFFKLPKDKLKPFLSRKFFFLFLIVWYFDIPLSHSTKYNKSN